MTSELKDWMLIVLQLLTLGTFAWSAVKIINRNEREWDQRENRMRAMEEELVQLRSTGRELAGVSVRLGELTVEMQRVRDRLDRFLDMRAGAEKC